jgi:hypothetical protein
LSNQAGWECDACRKYGLEVKRRCGFQGLQAQAVAGPVWLRGKVALNCCPKSYISAESEGMVEDFLVRRRMGGMDFRKLTARQVEAFLVLEQALTEELAARRGRVER